MSVLRRQGSEACFFCPGCKDVHMVRVAGTEPWILSGSDDAPTLSPSILVTAGPLLPDYRCHSFVKEGKIQFLADCSHQLKGQTVPLPAFRWSDPEERILK